MNSQQTKKWTVLIGLLALTLVLVWKAPEPDDTALVVQPKRHSVTSQMLIVKENESKQSGMLKERMIASSSIDVFDSPRQAAPEKRVITPAVVRKTEEPIRVPFKYIGKLEQKQSLTLFLMSGTSLYLVQQGDIVDEQFKLQAVDIDNQELTWVYLPENKIQKTSMEK